jgi:hypothetical protein
MAVEQGRKSLHKRVGHLGRKDADHTLTIHTLLNAQGAGFVGAGVRNFRIWLTNGDAAAHVELEPATNGSVSALPHAPETRW